MKPRLVAQTPFEDFFNNIGSEDFVEYLSAKPNNFFYAFVQEVHNPAPSFFKKRFSPSWRRLTAHPIDSISESLLLGRFEASINPITWLSSIGNYEFKIHVSKEKFFIPQFTFSLGQLFYIPIYASLSPEVLSYKNFNFGAVFPALTLSKSMNHYSKFFLSYSYVYFYLLRSSKFLENLISEGNDAKKASNQHYLAIGFSFLQKDSNIENTLILGFNANQNDFYFKVEQSSKFLAWGFLYTPTGVLSFRPYLRAIFLF